MAWFEGWDQPPDQKVIEEETCAEQQRGNEMKKREKKLEASRDNEAGRTMRVVYKSGETRRHT